MSTQFLKEQRIRKEGGFTLLGTVFVASLVMGIGALGILAMAKNSSTTVYGENAANQARTAALMGINALAQYTQQQYTSGSLNGVAGVPVGTAVVQSMGAQGNGPLSSVQAAVIANTYYNPPVVSVNVLGNTLNVLPQPLNQNGAIFVQSTGRAGPYAETARAVLTLQQNKASGAFVPTTYDIFARGTALFHGGTITGKNATIGVGGAATIKGGATIGRLDAGQVSLNGSSSFSGIRAENSFNQTGHSQGTVQLGNNVIGGLPSSTQYLVYQSLTKQETQQLNQNITQTPLINATGLKNFAGLQFMDSNGNTETGMIVVSPTEAILLNQTLPNTNPILPGEYAMSTWNGESPSQILVNKNQVKALSNAICGGGSCLSYSGGIFGTWRMGSGFQPGFAAFMYVQGGLSVGGESGSASAPLYITIAATNAVTFGGSTNIRPYATKHNLCPSADPVCTGQTPNPGLVGLSIVSGSSLGGSSGITLNSHSNIYGSIASTGNITINGGGSGASTIRGRIVTNGNLVMNGKVGSMINGAQNANFGGGSPTVTPPIVAIRWLRWM
jgi:type II secretory pathway pseudopilin PulG